MANKNKKLKPFLAFAAAYLIWGLNTPLVKTSLTGVPVLLLVAFTYVVGGIFLTLLTFKKWKPVPRKYWLRILMATAIGYPLTLVLVYQGIKLTGGINSSLIYLMAPLLIFLLSIKVLREKFNSRLLFGLIVGGFGALLIVGAPLLKGGIVSGQGSLLGNLLVVLGALADVSGIILIKPVLGKLPCMQITSIRFIIASIVMSPLVVLQLEHMPHLSLTPSVSIAIAYNIIFATLIAYPLYHYGFSKISGEQSSLLHYLDPLAGVVGSIFLLHEQLTRLLLAGAGLVTVGLYIGEAHKNAIFGKLGHHR